MITGFRWQTVKQYIIIFMGSVVGKRAVVQGFGRCQSASAFLYKMGAKVVGIVILLVD
jgi:glutamate dehydrogenase/leucine dehydrogenase